VTEADRADSAPSRLAAESLAANDPTGWFERLYAEAADGRAVVPWDRGGPQPRLVEWAEARRLTGYGRRALVVGAGLGDDAEYVAGRGFATVAFDVSATAVETARRRFPDSRVRYRVADLLDPPAEWRGAFDLVVESITVQALPVALHGDAIDRVAALVAPGGTLLVFSGARDAHEPAGDGPPWPLTAAEIDAFATGGLRAVRIEELQSLADPGARAWRAEFRRVP
jgi:cyclopropane fatty-acyl-phospholipid synthase-like methyltransferase